MPDSADHLIKLTDTKSDDLRKSGLYETAGVAYNGDLLALIPTRAQNVIDVGCNTGGLAAAIKRRQPTCHVIGMELREEAARVAATHCDRVYIGDIEALSDAEFLQFSDRQCWIFGDVLEHLVDPWITLRRIHRVLPSDGCIATCLPNMQHWSIQAKLASGQLYYEAGGLLDHTHLRWFTRQTALRMFDECGYRLEIGYPRIFDEPQREPVIGRIRELVACQGLNSDMAVNDALPIQYVMRYVKK